MGNPELENSPQLSVEAVHRALTNMTDENEWLTGVPMLSIYDINHPLVLSAKTPMKERFEAYWAEKQVADDGTKIINHWSGPGVDTIICRDEKGTFAIRLPHDGWRNRAFISGLQCRLGSQTIIPEVRALQKLANHVSEQQYKSYLLCNAFIERSKRSDRFYIFRKGLPTLVLKSEPKLGLIFDVALCLHPIGYYEDTFVGVMPPTDEVIAHLLFMRADEPKFWAKSGQHGVFDPRSGL